jgi:hypothetical protein
MWHFKINDTFTNEWNNIHTWENGSLNQNMFNVKSLKLTKFEQTNNEIAQNLG